MAQVELIQAKIESLSQEEYARLRRWFAEKDWERWDKQIAKDPASGKLDFLIDEALSAKVKEENLWKR